MTRGTLLRWTVVVALVALLAVRIATRRPTEEFRATPNVLAMPHLRAMLPPERSALWCGTLQMAFDRLPQQLVGAHASEEPIAQLTLHDFSQDDVRADRYFVAQGELTPEFRRECLQEIGAKFPAGQPRLPAFRDAPDWYAAVAYLQVASKFAYKFKLLTKPLPFHLADRTIDVKAFVIGDPASFGQVRVLAYENRNSFVVGMETEDPELDLWLAKIVPTTNLKDTIDDIVQRVADAHEKINPSVDGPFAVPRLELNVAYEREWTDPGLLLFQETRFRLNEYGVELYSTAMTTTESAVEEPTEPREFLFDRPFLVLTKEKSSSKPFFAAWIADAEVLEAW